MLNLALYARLMNAATRLQCDGASAIDGRSCFEEAMASIADESMAQSALGAIRTFARRKDVDGVLEVEANLNVMALTPDGETLAVRFLQATADVLHSSTQLVPDKTTRNNYAVDRLASLIWFHQGNLANALTWDKRALADLVNTHFADPSQARSVKASIYRDMLSIMNQSRNYAEVAAYGEKVARLVGGYGAAPAFDRVACEAQFRIKQYIRALRVCSAIIDASEDWQARFFRARVYDALNRDKQAIDDYQAVADSSVAMRFRTYAAIAISIIYDKQHKVKDALDTLDGFASLFTPQRPAITSADLAAYYNDLCYNKMQLGLSKAALADCNISLRYGDIPDAVAKKQQLLRRLGEVSGAAVRLASPTSSGAATSGMN
jgi:tetratricopeptide (TPR) repeat protein